MYIFFINIQVVLYVFMYTPITFSHNLLLKAAVVVTAILYLNFCNILHKIYVIILSHTFMFSKFIFVFPSRKIIYLK